MKETILLATNTKPILATAFACLIVAISNAHAGSAQWLANPIDGNWNNVSNWTIGGPPNGAADTGTLGTSSQTSISVSSNTQVNGVAFTANANPFTITTSATSVLTISGVGITNNSSNSQTFVADTDANGHAGSIQFTDNATAGNSLTAFTSIGSVSSGASGATIQFLDTSTAGSASFTASAPTGGTLAGRVVFLNNSTAGSASFLSKGATGNSVGGIVLVSGMSSAANATFITEGAQAYGAYGGAVGFDDQTTGGSATMINNGSTVSGASGGRTVFEGLPGSTAGNATLIANGGTGGGNGGVIQFGSLFANGYTSGGTARVEVFGNGTLDISFEFGAVTIGSLEGSGLVSVGANNLTVGSNNMSTSFSGLIRQSGVNGGGKQGSFSKIGSGTFTFEGANNDHIGDTLTLGLITGSPINLNFIGTPDAVLALVVDGVQQAPGTYGGPLSGVPHQIPQLTGTGTLLVRAIAVSRRLHAGVPFDILLPFTGPPGIECRSGGATGAYQIVVMFANAATITGASVTEGDGYVSSVTGNGTTVLTLNLAEVFEAQRVVVRLSGLNDNTTAGDLDISMTILIGDTTGNGTVSASDVSQVKLQSGQPVTNSNFREDINASGTINSSDVSSVKSRTGTALSSNLLHATNHNVAPGR